MITLRNIIRILNNKGIIIVMGDFNAKTGEGDFIGQFGLGTTNERGDML